MKRGPLKRERLADELAFFFCSRCLRAKNPGHLTPSNRPPNSHLLSSFILRLMVQFLETDVVFNLLFGFN